MRRRDFIMKRKTIVATGLAALAILCGVLLLGGKPQEAPAAPVPGKETPSRNREIPEEDSVQRDLIARYSDARVKLARHAVETTLEVKRSTLEIGLRILDLHRSNERPKNGMLRDQIESPLAGLRRRFGDTHGELRLSPEQEEQAVTIQLDLFEKQALDFKERIERLESRKDELQRLMLASDACQRKELSEEEYQSLLAATDEEMQVALMPPDENRLGMESSFPHPEFNPRFLALLDERPQEVFRQAPEGLYLDDNEKPEKAPAPPPAMSLDSRDKKLTALNQMLGTLLEMFQEDGEASERRKGH